jgi:hypothetical protein
MRMKMEIRNLRWKGQSKLEEGVVVGEGCRWRWQVDRID